MKGHIRGRGLRAEVGSGAGEGTFLDRPARGLGGSAPTVRFAPTRLASEGRERWTTFRVRVLGAVAAVVQ